MKKRTFVLCGLVGLLGPSIVPVSTALAGPVLVGSTSDGMLFDIDPTTGLASNPRDTGLYSLGGIAYAPSRDVIFALGTAEPGGSGMLFTLDPTTGQSNPVGTLDFVDGSLFGLAFDPTSEELVGLWCACQGGPGGGFAQVDQDSGHASVAAILDPGFWTQFAVSPSGITYILDPFEHVLASSEIETGRVLNAVEMDPTLGLGPSMAFGSAGELYLLDGGFGASDRLFRVDPFTGATDLIGHTGMTGTITNLTYVPEPSTLLGFVIGSLALGMRSWRRLVRRHGVRSQSCVVGLVLIASSSWSNIQARAGEGGPSETEGGVASAVPFAPLYSLAGHANFVVGGSGTRIWLASSPPLPGADPITVSLSGVPSGATIERAIINWSYLTNNPGSPEEIVIDVNGTQVAATRSYAASPSLCWPRSIGGLVLTNTAAYSADVTELVAARYSLGRNDYQVGGARDKAANLAEGVTLLVVYTHPGEPLRAISVWEGLIQVTSPTVRFVAETLQLPVAYSAGPLDFFVNALDGQCPLDGKFCNCLYFDDFFINDQRVSGSLGLSLFPNAWRGRLGLDPLKPNMYDHLQGDISPFPNANSSLLTFKTAWPDGRPPDTEDCVGHTLAAVAMIHPDWCNETVVAGGPHDCNCNGIPDVCDIRDATSADVDKNHIPDECDLDCNLNDTPDRRDLESGVPMFGAGQLTPSVGGTQRSITAAARSANGQRRLLDVNQDTVLDLVIASDQLNAVKVLLGAGDGNFEATPTTIGFAGSGVSAPYEVAIGDFDGDQDLDLAVAHRMTPGRVSIVLNQGGAYPSWNGYGTPLVVTLESNTQSPESIRTDDLDGDGDLDLVVGNRFSKNISILFNDGSGNFALIGGSPRSIIGNLLASDVEVRGIDTGDLNSDGRADIVVATHAADAVAVILSGVGTDFSMNLQAPQTFPICPASNGAVSAVTLSDIQRDGKPDVVVLMTGNVNETLGILDNRGTVAGGWLGFAEARLVPPFGGQRWAVAAFDMNKDGFDDILVVDRVTSGSGKVRLFLNDRTGEFGLPTEILIGSVPECVAVGDFDVFNDIYGRPDIAVASTIGSTSVAYKLNTTQIPAGMDLDRNGVLDSCIPATAVAGEPAMNRYVSFVPGTFATPTAYRVRMISLQHPSPANAPSHPPPDLGGWEIGPNCTDSLGCARWVGNPTDQSEAPSEPFASTFRSTALQCTPVCLAEWGSDPVYLRGTEIVPSSVYEIQAVSMPQCNSPLACSAKILSRTPLTTARWGDVVSQFNPPSLDAQPNALDIQAIVDKFKYSTTLNPSRKYADLFPAQLETSRAVDGLDIVMCVDAFKGLAYPFGTIPECPP